MGPTTPCIWCHTTLWNINVRKQAINDRLQGSVATDLRCGGDVNNQIKTDLLLSLSVEKFKSVNILQSYKQEGGCVVARPTKWQKYGQKFDVQIFTHALYIRYLPIFVRFSGRNAEISAMITRRLRSCNTSTESSWRLNYMGQYTRCAKNPGLLWMIISFTIFGLNRK